MLRWIPIRLLATVAVVCALTTGMIATAAQAAGSGPPVQASAPSIKGKALDGAKLKASSGAWSGAKPIAHAFVWERCDSAGANCEAIGGATADKYRATPADVGHRL